MTKNLTGWNQYQPLLSYELLPEVFDNESDLKIKDIIEEILNTFSNEPLISLEFFEHEIIRLKNELERRINSLSLMI